MAGAADAIRELVALKVLESEKPYVDIVQFRNLIVHEYERVDPDILFDLATGRLGDFRKFRNELDQALDE